MDIAREKGWRGKFRRRGRVIRPGAIRRDGKCPLTPLEEAFGDPDRDESVIIEVLELKEDVSDDASVVWFLQDLAMEQDAQHQLVIEQSGVLEAPASCCRTMHVHATIAVAQMAISKGRQRREAHNIVRVGMMLRGMGFDSSTLVYVAAGKIYKADKYMAPLRKLTIPL